MALILALTRTESAARLGVAAGVALLAWLALLGLLALITRARDVHAGPPAMDLPGDEPPAVVNLIASEWDLRRAAVPATLLDLAARKVLLIDQISPERFVCRLRGSAPVEALSDYERQVLDHVRSLAAGDGTVACEALTTGPQEQSERWWKRFRTAVVADARARGLSRPRWSKGALLTLSVAALGPAVLGALAFAVLPDKSSSGKDDPVGAFIAVVAVVWMILMALVNAMRAERDTRKGREVAARWLGLRAWVTKDGALADAPPAAVAVWDRYLGYGAALGVAATAVRALPLGSEADDEAWSAYGGTWRLVRIRYPKRLPPGYGRNPLLVAFLGLGGVIAGTAVTVALFGAWFGGGRDLVDRLSADGLSPPEQAGLVALGVIVLALALFVLRSLAMLVAGGADLFGRRQVDGVALRVREREAPYLAVDDGRSARVRAWLVEPRRLDASGVERGSGVRAVVSRRLNYVFRLETTALSSPPL